MRSSVLVGFLSATVACTGVIQGEAPGDPTGVPSGRERGGASSAPSVPVTSGTGSRAGRSYAPLHPAPAGMLRLLRAQYANAIADIFGAEVQVRTPLEADEATEHFLSVGAARVGTSERGVEQYREAALDVAEQVFARRSAYPELARCAPASAQDPCIDAFLGWAGRRLFRRPLLPAESARYRAIVTAGGAAQTQLASGMKFALAALLMSPSFLYVPLQGAPAAPGQPTPLTAHALASRLALVLWDSIPDEALLDAAERGALDETSALERTVRELLRAPRARGLLARFLGEQWLVSRLQPTSKNTAVLPRWTPALLTELRREFEATLEQVAVEAPGDLLTLLDRKQTVGGAALAEFYGLPPRDGDGLQPLALGPDRFGLLTSGAVIAANSPSDRSSPTHRGVFVIERLLCETVPPPPANVNDVLPEASTDRPLSVRERLEQHRANPTCAGCHAIFDPVGLTFEGFDAIGRARTEDAGRPVDTTGALEERPLSGPGDLAAALVRDPRVPACLASEFYRYAVAHDPGPGEDGARALVRDRFEDGGRLMEALVLAVTTSPGFRIVAAPEL